MVGSPETKTVGRLIGLKAPLYRRGRVYLAHIEKARAVIIQRYTYGVDAGPWSFLDAWGLAGLRHLE
jgi:hypothetical protein